MKRDRLVAKMLSSGWKIQLSGISGIPFGCYSCRGSKFREVIDGGFYDFLKFIGRREFGDGACAFCR